MSMPAGASPADTPQRPSTRRLGQYTKPQRPGSGQVLARCPNCRTALRVKSRRPNGKRIVCPVCRQPLVVSVRPPRWRGTPPVVRNAARSGTALQP